MRGTRPPALVTTDRRVPTGVTAPSTPRADRRGLFPFRPVPERVQFELEAVAGGWTEAVFGPPDQVDWRLVDDGRVLLRSYDSVHTALTLYDCASRERTTHPAFVGWSLSERDGAVRLELHGATVETTYADLAGALEPFLAALFRALDAETVGDGAAARDRLDREGPALADVPALYDRLVDASKS